MQRKDVLILNNHYIASTGEKIKKLRIEKGMTQKELADLIGISTTAIHKYESGKTNNISLKNLKLLAKFLDTRESFLLGLPNNYSYDEKIKNYLETFQIKTKNNEIIWLNFKDFKKSSSNKLIIDTIEKNYISKSNLMKIYISNNNNFYYIFIEYSETFSFNSLKVNKFNEIEKIELTSEDVNLIPLYNSILSNYKNINFKLLDEFINNINSIGKNEDTVINPFEED